MNELKFILAFFLLCYFTAFSQSDNSRTAIYLELLGNGGVYSINVEHNLKSNFYGRIGMGAWSAEGNWGTGDRTIVTFPVMGNMLFGEGSNKLEVGAGMLVGWSRFNSAFGEENDRSYGIFDLTGVVGYRYQKPEGGFLGRIGLTPFYAFTGGEDAYPDPGFFLSGGMSVGYSF